MTTNETTQSKIDKCKSIRDTLMEEGVHYGKVHNKQSDFLFLNGASLLADAFGIEAIMQSVNEETVDGRSQITVVINMLDKTGDMVSVGVGTWDSGEKLGNMDGARQRGIAMAYKRAYVLGVRYATGSHGMFSQDKEVVDAVDDDTPVYSREPKPPTIDGDEVIPAEFYKDQDGSYRFSVFGGSIAIKDMTVDEVLALKQMNQWGHPEGISKLNWVLKQDDVSQECKDYITNKINNPKPDTPDIDSIQERNFENRST